MHIFLLFMVRKMVLEITKRYKIQSKYLKGGVSVRIIVVDLLVVVMVNSSIYSSTKFISARMAPAILEPNNPVEQCHFYFGQLSNGLRRLPSRSR